MTIIKTILKAICLYIFCAFWCWLGWLIAAAAGTAVRGEQKPILPTIKQIQQQVGAKPDGILGRETQKKWDRAIFDQYARPYFVNPVRSKTSISNGVKGESE